MGDVSPQMKGTATREKSAYQHSFAAYAKIETSEVDPSLPSPNALIIPERCLLLSVIHQSIWDLICAAPQGKASSVLSPKLVHTRRIADEEWKQSRKQAERWLLGERDRKADRPMSLDWCCRELGVLAIAIRRRVKVTIGRLVDPSIEPYTKENLCIL